MSEMSTKVPETSSASPAGCGDSGCRKRRRPKRYDAGDDPGGADLLEERHLWIDDSAVSDKTASNQKTCRSAGNKGRGM